MLFFGKYPFHNGFFPFFVLGGIKLIDPGDLVLFVFFDLGDLRLGLFFALFNDLCPVSFHFFRRGAFKIRNFVMGELFKLRLLFVGSDYFCICQFVCL